MLCMHKSNKVLANRLGSSLDDFFISHASDIKSLSTCIKMHCYFNHRVIIKKEPTTRQDETINRRHTDIPISGLVEVVGVAESLTHFFDDYIIDHIGSYKYMIHHTAYSS